MNLPYELVGTYEPQSPEWYAARNAGLGGSEIGAVLALNKYESAFSLWHRKAGNVPLQPDNGAMEWGRRLEGVVAEKFAEEHPEYVLHRTPGTYRNRERTWQMANPDAFLFDAADTFPDAPTALYEGKTARYADEWGAAGTDDVPLPYLVQCRWMLDLFGLDVCHLAVLIAGSEYREYLIRADPDDALLMRAAGEAFMQSLEANEPPDLDGHSATYEAVRTIHPDIDRVDIEVDSYLASSYRVACEALTNAEDDKRYRASRLLDAMGTARRATVDGVPVALRVPARNGAPFLKLCKETA